MKKFIYALLFLATMATSAQSQILWKLQPFKIGVKAGTNIANLDIKDIPANIFSADANVGYHVGLQSRLTLGPLFAQPELLYSSYKVKYSLYETDNHQYDDARINSIDVPVLVGYKIGLLRLGVGVNFTVYDNKDGVLFNDGAPLNKESLTSYIIGAGVNFSKITVDARYVRNFKGASQSIIIDGKTLNPTLAKSNYQLSVGYMF